MNWTTEIPTQPGWYWVNILGLPDAIPTILKITSGDEDGSIMRVPDFDNEPLKYLIKEAEIAAEELGYTATFVFSDAPIPLPKKSITHDEIHS